MRRLSRLTRLSLHFVIGVIVCYGWLWPTSALRLAWALDQRRELVRWWTRVLLRILGVQVRCDGTPNPGRTLLVANHISWLDIPCLLACTDVVFVAKSEVARWPLIGILAGHIGTIFLERGRGANATVQTMAAALRRDGRVAVFPEGTSTGGQRVLPFYPRLFQAAIDTAAPVQAVAIRYPHAQEIHPHVPFIGNDNFLGHLWRLLGEPEIQASLAFSAPLSSENRPRSVLAVRTRTQILAALPIASKPAPSTCRAVTRGSRKLQDGFILNGDTDAANNTAKARPWKTPAMSKVPVPGESSSTRSTPH
jgi:1-acyl-sn-glycerol-3-phosphate acyltransferase